MLIINADDWGRSVLETDRAFDCFQRQRITSVSAMVFMNDSERAAELARRSGLPAGLHLNLSEPFTGVRPDAGTAAGHEQIVRFLMSSKYAVLIYNPWLRLKLRQTFQAQLDEFVRLYGQSPTHIDGHQHRHLWANLLFEEVIPRGQRVRRSFSFWPGEKGLLNRSYRRWVDRGLQSRYRVTDFFFSLRHGLQHQRLHRVFSLARTAKVELMTHPKEAAEFEYLMSAECEAQFRSVPMNSYLAV